MIKRLIPKIHFIPYRPSFKKRLLDIWERSVRATHDFLLSEDIDFFKTIVEGIDFHSFPVFIAFTEEDRMVGFWGVNGRQLEMLFLDPDFIGIGIGSFIMDYAIREQGVKEVEVNESNTRALEFYKKFGFKILARKPLDNSGRPYPILRLGLSG